MRLFIISILTLLFLVPAKAQVKFEIIYGGSGYDHARSVWQTDDNGYIVSGFSNVDGTANTEVFLLKTDSVGAIKWFKFHGGPEIQAGKCVQQTTDGGYIVGGYTNENIGNAYDFLLMKFDQAGDLVWKKTYGGEDWDLGEYVEQTFDGGYIIGGSTFSTGNGGEDGYLVKTDASGNIQWSKTYGGALDDQFQTVRQCLDSGFVAIGRSTSFGNGDEEAYVVRTNKSGDTTWTKTLTEPTSLVGDFIEQTSDLGFVTAGRRRNLTEERNDMWHSKLDVNGQQEWVETSDFYGYDLVCIREVPWDNGFMMGGATYAGVGAGGKDFSLFKSNSVGWFEFGKNFGGIDDEIGYSLQVTNDNGFVIVGETYTYGAGLINIYLVKTDSLGNSSGTVVIGMDEDFKKVEAQIYPNPTVDEINLVLPENVLNESLSLNMYNVKGQLVLSSKLESRSLSTIDIRQLKPGVYFLEIIGESFISRNKIIKGQH